MGKLGAGLAQYPLEQGFLAGHQQRALTAVNLRRYRLRGRRRDGLGRLGNRRRGGWRVIFQPPVTCARNCQRDRHGNCRQRQHRPTVLSGHGRVLRRRHHRLTHRLRLRLIGRDFDGDRRESGQVIGDRNRNRQGPNQRRLYLRLLRQLIQRQQQRRRIREAFRRVFGQQLAQHLLITPMVHRQLRQRFSQVRQRGGKRIGAVVWQLAHEDFIEHHAQRIQVGAPVNFLAPGLLRAHVARRANGKSGLGELRAVIQGLGDAKVRQHRRAIRAEQNVRRLHIAVYQALGVGITQRRGDLADIRQPLLRRQARGDALLERAIGQVFHGHVVQLTDIADVMDGHGVRVGQARQGLAFAQEALAETRVGRQRRRHDLQRHLALQGTLGRQVHAGHGANADFAFDVVAGNDDVHVDTFTTMAVMLSGAPRLSPRCTRLRTISSGSAWLSTSRISWSSTVLFRPSLHSR